MRLGVRNRRAALFGVVCLLAVTMVLFKFSELRPTCLFKDDQTAPMMIRDEKFVLGTDQKVYPYHRNMPLIFIGGVPRSGTTLMRAMLDAHPDVRCGQETRVIPRILQLRSHWLKSEKESVRLQEAGISKEVMNSAIAQFCLEIIAKHGEPASRLCNKDPLTLKMGSYVIELFPQAKFLFMVRDGRATVHSIISRKVTITGFDLTSYRQCLTKWNHAIETMHEQCKEIGRERCMMVYYEQLVLHPEEWMRKILKFLDVPWNESVLHHEEFINKPNGVSLSKVERSSDQVIKPVNLEALSKWVGHIPDDVVRDMADIAPMLSILGYDPYANPPDYGKPDSWVKDNTSKVKANKKLWDIKADQLLNRNEVFDKDEKENNSNSDDAEAAAAPDQGNGGAGDVADGDGMAGDAPRNAGGDDNDMKS
ncbi:protein-tyrosine sulfotransferase isoform X1 [Lutzomyia longipalpis]|uniref:protein-tyrosine sulfotransferase isoform X1 n=1 Tax=Lutzomyia longipalpis TaxID=7200 RepID=UPI0024836AE8|nr:protein-tyrosine sulfotransferase isoform X1 [Lutzomyia longipalpis]XP_055683701.1 protein-tyrosine sulfotransferase isoform X1 [Lutzomyia longipalpis]XP_055683702.1 protein-tyrosine sulfotransferase isoform X1 [Lutzomyia longipalpis]